MSIIRSPRPEGNFYILNKSISEDKSLGWAARGLLVYLLGKPDHWTVSVQALVNEVEGSSEASGRDRTYSLINQLVQAGYITRRQGKGDGGKFSAYDYLVNEIPVTDQPLPDQPYTDQPLTVKPTVVSIDSKQGLKEPKPRAERARISLTVADLVDAGVNEQHAIDWMAIRNKKRAPLTRTAAEALAREAAKAGISVPEAVKVCAERGWQSLKAEWLTERKTAQQARSERNALAFDYEYQMGLMEGL